MKKKKISSKKLAALKGKYVLLGTIAFVSLVMFVAVEFGTRYFVPAQESPFTFSQNRLSQLLAQAVGGAAPYSNTLQGRLMVGYQGWFSYPGAQSGTTAYGHWTKGNVAPAVNNLAVDMWPDLAEFAPTELNLTALKFANGSAVSVYSAANAATVARHVQWMRQYDIDGAFIQRFVVTLGSTSSRSLPDAVLKNFQSAAETQGRTFAVMYDLSGAKDSEIATLIKSDWQRIVDQQKSTAYRSYQRHENAPVVGLWGVGFSDRTLSSATILSLIRWFKTEAPVRYRATVLLGVPMNWRLGTGDAEGLSKWAEVYQMADVLSPWTVGRLTSEQQIVDYYKNVASADRSYLSARAVDYLPVVYPGFSWRNLTGAASNQISRRGGNLLWWQVREARAAGNGMLYAAMFDEVDEGTALFKLVPKSANLPVGVNLIALDVDGYPLPNDWYLSVLKRSKAVLIGQAWTPLAIPAPNTIEGFVENLYRNILNRGSDAGGKASHVGNFQRERTLLNCQNTMRAFYGSPEFTNQALTDRAFATTLYRAVFGREPDETGLTSWANQLTSRTVTREQLREIFVTHAEAAAFCKRALGI